MLKTLNTPLIAPLYWGIEEINLKKYPEIEIQIKIKAKLNNLKQW